MLWLEEYLNSWNNTLIVVSHDRDFLNNVVTDIVLMKDKKLTKFKGNYDQFEKTYHEQTKALVLQKQNRNSYILMA